MNEYKIKIGITQGDINGIGYEVIIKALSDSRILELCTPIIYGSSKVANFHKKQTEDAETFNFSIISKASEASPIKVNLVNCCTDDIKVETGTMTPEAGVASVAALRMAAADLKAGIIDVVVTAPICKENVQSVDFAFTGHTEFFASEFGGTPLMMMCSEILKVGLVTIHIPVAEVSTAITKEVVVEKLRALNLSLIKDFSINSPRIAVLGLNPHSGDGGLIGNEEIETITPAIREASNERILAFGPFAADGFFASEAYKKYDAVLAMYHDQGLIPFKSLSEYGVNFTAGLPVVRTSPAHGVGFDIAGKNSAEARSMREAIYLAMDTFRSRKIYAKITANPLQRYKRDSGVDTSVKDLPEEIPVD